MHEMVSQPHPHLATLMRQHASLAARVEDEAARPHPDGDALRRLKAAKLRVKDRMERIRSSGD